MLRFPLSLARLSMSVDTVAVRSEAAGLKRRAR